MIKKLLALLAMLYAAASFAAVDVNSASAADLDGVKGIGPGLSGKIIKERKKGNFKDWNDLISRVKGMGEKNAARFSADGMTVNGTAFSGPATASTAAKPAAAAAPAATATSSKAPAPIVTQPSATATKPAPGNMAAPAAPSGPAAPATKQ
jgi:competence protein ComEA